MKHAFLAAALLFAAASTAPAWAGSVTQTLPITIQAPLQLVFTPAAPSVPCNAAPGTVVAAISVSGGDGNTLTYTASGGDTTDFAISGANVVVGANGMAAASCGQTTTVKITASQP